MFVKYLCRVSPESLFFFLKKSIWNWIHAESLFLTTSALLVENSSESYAADSLTYLLIFIGIRELSHLIKS